jgi:hypothetical protein
VGDLVGLMLDTLDRIHDWAPPGSVRPEQVNLQLGRLYTEGGDRGEEVEELLVAGQETHGILRSLSGGKIAPPTDLARYGGSGMRELSRVQSASDCGRPNWT